MLCKSLDLFLYDNGLRHGRVKHSKRDWAFSIKVFMKIEWGKLREMEHGDALHDLVSFLQIKSVKKTHGGV